MDQLSRIKHTHLPDWETASPHLLPTVIIVSVFSWSSLTLMMKPDLRDWRVRKQSRRGASLRGAAMQGLGGSLGLLYQFRYPSTSLRVERSLPRYESKNDWLDVASVVPWVGRCQYQPLSRKNLLATHLDTKILIIPAQELVLDIATLPVSKLQTFLLYPSLFFSCSFQYTYSHLQCISCSR